MKAYLADPQTFVNVGLLSRLKTQHRTETLESLIVNKSLDDLYVFKPLSLLLDTIPQDVDSKIEYWCDYLNIMFKGEIILN